MKNRAVFLDKDGTLIENVPYNVDPGKIRLTDGALTGLSRLQQAGYSLFIVTNQSGIAHGYFDEQDVYRIEEHLREILERAGIALEGFYFCPHHPDGIVPAYSVACQCRKPNPGLIFQAAGEHQINLADSWLIGDVLNDIEAGKRANCRTILMNANNETEWNLLPLRRPDYIVKNLAEAADVILLEDRLVPIDINKVHRG
jgi:D-glycero-D-manno-heptose 1,7-bisphosphate phosphatase